MKKIQVLVLAKYVIGSVLSVLCATAIGLRYAYSAGIITLLTIQETRGETVRIAWKRMVVFFIMTLLSMLLFPVTGYHVWAFGIILIPYLSCCMLLDMKEAITSIAVLCTHYIAAGSVSPSIVLNELFLLLVGVGIGIFINSFMPDSRNRLILYQTMVDDTIVHILQLMAVSISNDNKAKYMNICFADVDALLVHLKKEALFYQNNHFLKEEDYYYEYMRMRDRQCNILKRIAIDISRITVLPEQAELLADFIRKIANEFEENNDACNLLYALDALKCKYSVQELPKTREEFENRAMLYHILEDIRVFLQIKLVFSGIVKKENAN